MLLHYNHKIIWPAEMKLNKWQLFLSESTKGHTSKQYYEVTGIIKVWLIYIRNSKNDFSRKRDSLREQHLWPFIEAPKIPWNLEHQESMQQKTSTWNQIKIYDAKCSSPQLILTRCGKNISAGGKIIIIDWSGLRWFLVLDINCLVHSK